MTQPRDTADVINTRGTAATLDVQTTPTDTTAGALLNNETTSIGGQVNYTGGNYQPTALNGGINVPQLIRYNGGPTVIEGAAFSGSLLSYVFGTTAGALSAIGTGAGTWINVGNANFNTNDFFLAVRVA
tara:strand:+ start:1217 stop:1603 length:387 start_codon:yes stop_codon:yes gene_type:complete